MKTKEKIEYFNLLLDQCKELGYSKRTLLCITRCFTAYDRKIDILEHILRGRYKVTP